jgi:Asp-tRNA(Asn)/Glu-tRNA(Gln) amidotransferase C subunit
LSAAHAVVLSTNLIFERYVTTVKSRSTGKIKQVKLLARMELRDSTPEKLYRTIAEIIAFAWNLKGKFLEGHDPQAPRVERDVTDRGGGLLRDNTQLIVPTLLRGNDQQLFMASLTGLTSCRP